jgi:hypothetical protein
MKQGIRKKNVCVCVCVEGFRDMAPKAICTCKKLKCEPGSSVSIVSGYGLDDWVIEVRSPAEKKELFL